MSVNMQNLFPPFSEEVSGRQQQLPPGVGGGQARPGDGRGITPAVTFQSILR